MNQRALAAEMPWSLAWSLGGGLVRLAALLAGWRMGVRAGWPETLSGICLVAMYLSVMVAGVAALARDSSKATNGTCQRKQQQ